MNTRSIELAAQIICARLARPNAVPATIAVALDANGLLNGVDGAAELLALRARVAELEAERGSLVADRDAQIIAWLGKKAREYGTSNREARDKAEAVARMADKLRRGAVRPLEDPCNSLHRFEPEYQGVSDAKRRLAQCKQCGKPRTDSVHSVEDPYDSPLHHDYKTGRDLPEVPHA